MATRKKAAAGKTAARKTTKKAALRRTAKADANVMAARLDALEARLAERLDGIEARLGTAPQAPSTRAPGVSGDMDRIAARLSQALDEVPRAADFEPLAEHIYQLARHAPRLLETLEALPAAIAPFEASVRALQETAETLQGLQESFSESLLRLPRAEDYEPLSAPLAEFARVSPALADSLADVLRVVTPLSKSVAVLQRVADQLSAAPAPASGAASRLPADLIDGLKATAKELLGAREALETALGSLPRDPQYKRVAEQLREIATVSPSLMEWMEQVTPLSRPLGHAVSGLRETAGRLAASHERLESLLERLG